MYYFNSKKTYVKATKTFPNGNITEKEFSIETWDLLPPEKDGWRLVKNITIEDPNKAQDKSDWDFSEFLRLDYPTVQGDIRRKIEAASSKEKKEIIQTWIDKAERAKALTEKVIRDGDVAKLKKPLPSKDITWADGVDWFLVDLLEARSERLDSVSALENLIRWLDIKKVETEINKHRYVKTHSPKQKTPPKKRESTELKHQEYRDTYNNYLSIEGKNTTEAVKLTAKKHRTSDDTIERALGWKK